MKFKIGTKVKVTHCYSGAEFDDGEIVTIVGTGFEDDPDCYECEGEGNSWHWYLYEDEVVAVTNGDKIRSMDDKELAEFLNSFKCSGCVRYGNNCFPNDAENWLKEEYNDQR